MNGRYILDAEGHPVPEPDLLTWARWFESAERRRVAVDAEHDWRVSTVFLGLDHSFGHHGDPVLWETMVFGGPLDGESDRYSSLADAQRGHAAMCERVRAAEVGVSRPEGDHTR